MEKIKHIFFDLDNTLWDYRKNAGIAIRVIFEEFEIEKKYGHSFDDFYIHYYEVNENLWAEYRDEKISRPELQKRRFPESFESLGVRNPDFAEDFEKRFMEEVSAGTHLVPHTVEILEYLKNKYKLHIITNGFAQTTQYKIENSVLKNYFETVTTAESAGAPKPNPISFVAGINASKAKVNESIYIGDDWYADILGATSFGMKAIFFNPLDENHLWIDEVPVIDELNELKNYL